MMNFKELLDIAKSELKDLTTVENPDFRLEEAVYKKDLNNWEIVVSFLVENTNPRNSPVTSIISEFKYHRIYKRLIINEENNIIGYFIYEK